MRRYIVIGLMGLMAMSCKKSSEKLEDGDYILFGTFYGFCMGEECREMYMLTIDKLYEDIDDGNEVEYVELPTDLYADVHDIKMSIPADLTALPDSTFGCPDCHDQGGVFLRIKKDDVDQSWTIDNDLDAIPTYLHSIVDLIHEKVELINN